MSGAAGIVGVLRTVARNPELRRVETAYAAFNVSELGTWLAMLVFAYGHGGVTEAGVLATVMLVPAALAAPALAAIGERHAPGRFLVAGYAAQALTCAAVAAAMLAHAGTLAVYGLLLGPAIAFTMTRPTQAAFAPGLARRPEQLAATNVVNGWIESLSGLAGPLLVGVVLTFSSPGIVFAVGGALCAVGVLRVLPLRDAVAASATRDKTVAGGSVAFVRKDPNARALVLLLGAQYVAIGALDVLYVELARGVLHLSGNWAGYLNAAFGVGSVLAIFVTARLLGARRLAIPLALSLAGWTVGLFGLAATPGVAATLLLLGVAGIARSTFDVTARTLLQRVARPDLLARVFGLLESSAMIGLAAGSLIAPALVSLSGPGAAFAGVGLILPLVALTVGRRLLDIDRHATVPVVEIALLRSMPMFTLLPPPTLESLARALVPLDVPAGATVMTQGEQGDRLYAIADGEVEVVSDGRFVATLGRGDAVGEIALMYDVPRTATVRALRDSRLYALDRETFLAAVTGHLHSRAAVQGLADERLDELQALREADVN